jgi:5-methylcytosine-specific restriction endonuclease McrA
MPNKDPEKEREYQRRYNEEHREARTAHKRAWAANNRDRERKRQQRWREANPEKVRDNNRRYYEENEDKARESSRRYHAGNPDKHAARMSRRRARKLNAPQGDPVEAAAYAQILREGICEVCGSKGPIEIDHIEPLSKGGAHDWTNMAGLCKSCNASKGDKSLLHFLLDRRG